MGLSRFHEPLSRVQGLRVPLRVYHGVGAGGGGEGWGCMMGFRIGALRSRRGISCCMINYLNLPNPTFFCRFLL